MTSRVWVRKHRVLPSKWKQVGARECTRQVLRSPIGHDRFFSSVGRLGHCTDDLGNQSGAPATEEPRHVSAVRLAVTPCEKHMRYPTLMRLLIEPGPIRLLRQEVIDQLRVHWLPSLVVRRASPVLLARSDDALVARGSASHGCGISEDGSARLRSTQPT
jgi:hypothetical protein